jgi:hypothetical protein
MTFDIRLMRPETSGIAPSPQHVLEVPTGFKIVGGGAVANYTGYGSLLTASYPQDLQHWYARSKDQGVSDPTTITVYALALYDPNNEWDVIIVKGVNATLPGTFGDAIGASPACARAFLPQGYTLTGGGAFVDWHGYGNLLTASYPISEVKGGDSNGWEAQSKDHTDDEGTRVPDPSTLTAYAIGIRASCTNSRKPTVKNHVVGIVSPVPPVPSPPPDVEPHPRADGSDSGHPKPCLGTGGVPLTRSGGGVIDHWGTIGGNLLTASYPDPSNPLCWIAAGKDHTVSSPAWMEAFVIGIEWEPAA